MEADAEYMKSAELRYDMGAAVKFTDVRGVDALMLEEASYFPLTR